MNAILHMLCIEPGVSNCNIFSRGAAGYVKDLADMLVHI
jgi:hypothetical protein